VNHNRESQKEELFWIQQAKAGDTAAFEKLVQKHSPVLFRTVSRMISDRGDAEAVIQDAWLRAWRALPSFSTDGPFLPWIMKIAVNRSRDVWKKKQPLAFSEAEIDEERLSDEYVGMEQRIITGQALEKLGEGVSSLRTEYRTAIALRYDSSLPYQQIAEVMGVPVNTVRTYLRRAKQELRIWMEAEDG